VARRSTILLAATAVLASLVVTASATGASRRAADEPAANVCGTTATPPTGYDHVIWIWFENHSFSQISGSKYAPFFNALGVDCGLATSYKEVAWTSLPAYLDLTGGGNGGLPQGACDPGPTCQATNPSIFGQLEAAGLSWRGYAEDMPSNCDLAQAGRYDPERNPATYYTDVQPTCPQYDVPLGTTSSGNLASDLAAGTLPSFAYLTPNQCNAMEKKCKSANPIVNGDNFLRTWVTAITTSSTWAAGRTAIFVTFDEPKAKFGPLIYTVVVSPSTVPGTASSTLFTHFSLLRTTQDMLGLSPYLGQAASAASMAQAFNLLP